MLVLSRHRDERIVIDPRNCPVDANGLIVITVVDIRGDKVRIGCDVPRAMPCHRGEVWDAIQREQTTNPRVEAAIVFPPDDELIRAEVREE